MIHIQKDFLMNVWRYPICISPKTTDGDDGGDDGDDGEELFQNFSFVRFFFGNRSCRCDSIGPKIVKIGAILANFGHLKIFRSDRRCWRYKLTEVQIGSHDYCSDIQKLKNVLFNRFDQSSLDSDFDCSDQLITADDSENTDDNC